MQYLWLGPVEARLANGPAAIGGPQQRRLLALLIAQGDRAVSTDRIIEALWPNDAAPDGAVRSVKTYISRLRAALGEGAIVTSGSSYALPRPPGSGDGDEFESLIAAAERSLPDQAIETYDAALALWRGEPFGELAGEWWAVAEAHRLSELRTVAREQRAGALLDIGHPGRAVPDLESLVLEEPLRERPVALLIQALHRTGRTAEALRAYQAFRGRLVEETGLDPSAELMAIERAVAAGDPTAGDASAGRPLRGYVMGEPIGEGSVGRVYAATQPGTERPVAIKVIRPDLADSPAFIQRFEAEAQVVARLEHPHIVPLYDYWREPGGAYLVFRLLGGGTARQALVTDGAWSLARVSRVVEEIGGALIAAHAAGVVHNDVTASNVVLDDDCGTYLTDFGIARDGPIGAVPPGHDVEDLAWLVWELLTGRLRPVDRAAQPRLVGQVPGIPADVDAVLVRGVAAIGGFASVAELVIAWRVAVGRPEGVLSPLTSEDRRAVDSTRRREADELVRRSTAGVNPYQGLRPFDEADEAVFFGRDDVVRQLLEVIGEERFLAVVGASGSGKSSVVRAGVVPALRAAGRQVVVVVPGEDPDGHLHEALVEVAIGGTEGTPPWDLARAIADRDGGLVVVLDQFEELWTRSEPGDRARFLGAMVDRLGDPDDGVHVMVTIRADLLDRPLQDARVGALLGAGTFVLPPMSAEQLEAAIVEPAARMGVIVDEAVVGRLVADASDHPGALPLLQFTLAELYDRRVDAHIPKEAFATVGDLTRAVGRRAEQCFASLGPQQEPAARALFSRLVAAGAHGEDARRRAPLSELSADSRAVADEFVEARLLVLDRDQVTREPTVEVAHEALLTRWSRLAGWIDEDRAWLVQLQHLASSARAWDDGGRAHAELYRGSRLEAAIEAIDGQGRDVSPTEREFVAVGRHARDADVLTARRAAGRLRRLLAGVAVALVIALLAGAIAASQRREADESAATATAAGRSASVEALVGRSRGLQATQRDVAALLAVEAFRFQDTPRTRSALLEAVSVGDGLFATHQVEAPIGVSGALVDDQVFIQDADGRMRPFDLESGRQGRAFPSIGATGNGLLVPSPNGRFVAQLVRQQDGPEESTTIGVFDVARRTLVAEPFAVDGWAFAAVLADDASSATFVLGQGARVERRDVSTGGLLASAPAVEVDPESRDTGGGGLAVGRDGRLLAGAPTGPVRVLDPTTLGIDRTISVPDETTDVIQVLGDGSVVSAGVVGVRRFDGRTGAERWYRPDLVNGCPLLLVVEEQQAVLCGDPFGLMVERDLADGSVRRSRDIQDGGASMWATADGSELVMFGINGSVISQWRLDGSGPVTRVLERGWSAGPFSPDGRRMVVSTTDVPGQQDSALDFESKVIEVRTGQDVAALDGIYSPSWADDDTILGAAVADVGLTLVRYRISTGATEPIGEPLPDVPDFVASDTGKSRALLAYDSDEGSEIWILDQEGRRVGATIRVPVRVWMDVSRDGGRVVVGTVTGVDVFDGRTGRKVGSIAGQDLRGAFLTVADQLFVVSVNGDLEQYDLENLRSVRTFPGSRGFIQQLMGTTDGSLVAVRGGDRAVSLYDVASGERLGPNLDIATDEINIVSLSVDGSMLAVGGGLDRGMRLVDLDPDHWMTAACDLAGRNLTRKEWQDNIGDLAPYRETCPDVPTPS